MRASCLQIDNNDEIRDLLAKDPKNRLDLEENVDSGVYVKDLSSFIVTSPQEIDKVFVEIVKSLINAQARVRALEPRAKRAARHELHEQADPVIVVDAHAEQLDDVLVLEAVRRAELAAQHPLHLLALVAAEDELHRGHL